MNRDTKWDLGPIYKKVGKIVFSTKIEEIIENW